MEFFLCFELEFEKGVIIFFENGIFCKRLEILEDFCLEESIEESIEVSSKLYSELLILIGADFLGDNDFARERLFFSSFARCLIWSKRFFFGFAELSVEVDFIC